ncbi:MAG: polysaccharide deacetylase family protein [Pedobacter sp.]|nr:MAG: polysaccharide deacetylase family protein [Pedobacter sp.]
MFVGSNCLAQNPINISIAKYKDNKTAAISYTFDDGLKEHYTLVTPWLKKLGLKATFVVNGNNINKDSKNIKDTTRMTWPDLKEMAALGQEISNHGWAHKNFGKFPIAEIKEDILKNDSAIFANIGLMPRTFAYPNNTKSSAGVQFASQNRVGTRLFQRSIGGKSTHQNLEEWVNKLITDKDWGVGMTHGITYGYDHFSKPDILWEHLKKVKAKEDQIWVGTFKEVIAYVTERNSTVLQAQKLPNGNYNITPICNLDQTIYAEPLTAILVINEGKNVKIRQGNKKLKTTINTDHVLFNFDPFGGIIEVVVK